MGYPNSVLDPAPHVWGWPWHGLITQTGAGGTLPLPSGRVIDCPVFGGNWTYLWDIDMPPVDFEPDDPDEQWLTKGIIRAAANMDSCRIYGGRPYGSGPIKLGDHVGWLEIRFDWVSGVMNFLVSTSGNLGDGPFASESALSMTAEAAGFPATVPGGFPPQAQILDRSRDGTRCIVRVSRSRSSGISGAETLALIEVQVSGEIAANEAALVLLAGGTTTRGVVTVTTEPPPPPTGNITIGSSSAKVGTWITDSHMDAVVWAWYKPDGTPDLISYQVHVYATQVTTLTGDAASQTGSLNLQLSQKRTLTSSLGSATTDVTSSEVVTATAVSAGPLDITSTISMHVDDLEVLSMTSTQHSSGSIGMTGYWEALRTDIDPVEQALRWLYPSTTPAAQVYVGRQSLMSFQGLSNNVVDMPVQYLDNPDLVNPTRLVVHSDALTPGGADIGQFTYHTAVTTKAGNSAGSYNPITGQVLRNQDTELFSWV
ncbi:hypothetical protein [Pseudomonas sp. GV071]|uniref:hypothetical protein n=1 Tax=Pseudomonas sp. GV071 TaxID=2135754 RepID=UPI000D48AAA0|nr:hypothetical protein [Pseudomonas sp. GV071]PTQ70346.1 hypothetical protein C8K61_10668 [Pseudomonas sp. GV071]